MTAAYRVVLFLIGGLSVSLLLVDGFVGVDGSGDGDESENNDGDLHIKYVIKVRFIRILLLLVLSY